MHWELCFVKKMDLTWESCYVSIRTLFVPLSLGMNGDDIPSVEQRNVSASLPKLTILELYANADQAVTNQFDVCENWQLKLCRWAGVIKKIKARWRSLGILLLGNILCE